jgi:ABC-2 type transport system permease protein
VTQSPDLRAALGAQWRRLRALMRKESLQVVRDPSSIAIAFVLPLILLLLFGYGVSLDIRHLPVAVVIEDMSPDARNLFESFSNSPYIRPISMTNAREAEAALIRGDVNGIVVLRGDASRRYLGGSTTAAQVIVNGVDANTARFVGAYARGAAAVWLEQDLRRRGQSAASGAVVEHRVWFNDEVRSTNFLVPGVVAIVMTLIGALLTALVVAREWERGTMETMLVTPAGMAELILARLAVYFTLGMGGMAISVAMGVFLFGVPLRGSFAALALVTAVFLLGALGLGLLISAFARNQFVAGQIAIVVSYMPAFILSGFIFDIESMPQAAQWVTALIPARYFVTCLQTLFLAGDVWSVVLPNTAVLAVFAALFLGLTALSTRRRLD